jgi:hypothetical protein
LPKSIRDASLGVKIALFVSCLLIAMGVVINAVAFAVARGIVRAQIHERLRVVAADRHRMTLNYVAQQKERVALFTSRTQLRRLIQEHADGTLPAADMLRRTQPILSDAQRGTQGFEDIWVCRPDGQVISATREEYLGRNYSTDANFQQGKLHAHLGEPAEVEGGYQALKRYKPRPN